MTAPARLRVAVVGTGIMGSNHVRVLKQIPDAELVAVVDADLDRARAAANDATVMSCASIDELPGDLDAAVVAVPTSAHLATATALMRRGVHVLVEKPLAATVEEAEQIVGAATDAGVVLAVGHIERFNPAIAALAEHLTEPLHISAARISPYSKRISDGVVFDLMIHDIDIVCSLAGSGDSVATVSGIARALRGESEDLACVSMTFESGLTASFMTSRLGQQKVRTIEVTQSDSVVSADLVRADVTISRMTHHEFVGEKGASYQQSSVIEIPFIQNRGEPLSLELTDFLNAIRTGTQPRVGGADATRAVAIARRVVDSMTVSR